MRGSHPIEQLEPRHLLASDWQNSVMNFNSRQQMTADFSYLWQLEQANVLRLPFRLYAPVLIRLCCRN